MKSIVFFEIATSLRSSQWHRMEAFAVFLYALFKFSYDGGGDLEMKVIGDSLSFSTGGFNDMKDLTGEVSKKLSENKLCDLTMSFVLDPSFISQ